ncbi:MAG: cobyrinate a,c-diamide synthase [Acidiferrobacter sp.]
MTARVYLSAGHKSSGKTTIAIGLCAALKGRGLVVQPYKKGPDYIDPLWLTQASGRPCYNLDFHTMTHEEITDCFARGARGADILVVEGNKGLFDGVAVDGSNSNAALVHQLETPAVLVIDAHGISRGVAPLVIGYRHFDPSLPIAGVILNRVGGARHEAKLRAVLETYTDVPVLGAVWDSPALAMTERHLGLVPSGEYEGAAALIATLAAAMNDYVDVDAIGALGRDLAPPVTGRASTPVRRDVRIGVARDRAFSFYYPGDLEALQDAGAEIVFFDTLHDDALPSVDGLFIGGGFPETQAQALSSNSAMRASIRRAIDSGLPTYAECGGLMYLARHLTWGDVCVPMVGVIPGDIVMQTKPVGHGYIVLRPTADHPWCPERVDPAAGLPAHEFHYSRLVNVDPGARFAYDMVRGYGIDGHKDGIVVKNLLASYAHLRDVQGCAWTRPFVDFVRAHRAQGVVRAARCGRAPQKEECDCQRL